MFYWAYSLLIYGLIMKDLRTRVNRPFRVQKLNDAQQLTVTAFFIFLACLAMIVYSMLGEDWSRTSMRFFIGIMIFFFYLFALLAIFSFFFLMRVLGMGEDTKRKIMYRHLSLIVAFIVCNLYLLIAICGHPECSNKTENVQEDCIMEFINDWYMQMFSVLFYSQGLILSLIRMCEPGSVRCYVSLLKRLVMCDRDRPAAKQEPINMLFNSTLNIEFVYVILEGIVKLSKQTLDDAEADDDYGKETFEEDIEQELTYSKCRRDVTLRVREIEIEEFDSW